VSKRCSLVALGRIAFLASFLASCSLLGPTTEPTSIVALFVENRGGPAFDVIVNGVSVAVPCDAYPALIPGENGLPALPWTVEVRRTADGRVLSSDLVARLPAWYVQIGDTALGMNFTAVLGPAGPSCPPPGP
jgi:hypothetical protein